MRYDVLIVGAGPAGSAAARECASRGLSVLLLDKAAFPRDKPCGGGVNVRAARLLPFDLSPVIERTISGIHISLRRSHRFTRHHDQPLTYLTQRSRLDTLLVEHAVKAGAALRERATVRAVEREATHIIVHAGGDGRSSRFEGRTLVAADGANGQTARLAGLAPKHRMGIALEVNVTPPGGVPGEWEDVFGLDIGSVPGGYGWVFPRGDHLNIGVGGWRRSGPHLRAELERLVRFYQFESARRWGQRGHPLPVRARGAPLADSTVLLVGDAAGLLDPLTGDGIYSAIWSGQIAAKHLAAYLGGQASDLRGYAHEVEHGLLGDLRLAERLHGAFHHLPAVFVAIIERRARVWRAGCRILRGDLTYTEAWRRFLHALPATRRMRHSRAG